MSKAALCLKWRWQGLCLEAKFSISPDGSPSKPACPSAAQLRAFADWLEGDSRPDADFFRNLAADVEIYPHD
jgi:hypothetical protein